MGKLTFFLLIIIGVLPMQGQQAGALVFEGFQKMETGSPMTNYEMNLPVNQVVAIMGGLKDWDGMNDYFNFFGSKLIIESRDNGLDGITYLVLRREDGLNFFDLFPTLKAKFIPSHHIDFMDMERWRKGSD
jgi:hypothetical protein